MEKNYVNITFVIDKSGSMYESISDVIGGFNSFIKDQKLINEGKITVSLYTFNDNVDNVYNNIDINEIKPLNEENYQPGGCTALNDAVGMAIDKVGESLAALNEDERPETVIMVIMTDGEENSSIEYDTVKVREMIAHQTDKYNWKFIYLGTDITTTKHADNLGVTRQAYSSRSCLSNTMSGVANCVTQYRMSSVVEADSYADNFLAKTTDEYEKTTNVTIKKD